MQMKLLFGFACARKSISPVSLTFKQAEVTANLFADKRCDYMVQYFRIFLQWHTRICLLILDLIL